MWGFNTEALENAWAIDGDYFDFDDLQMQLEAFRVQHAQPGNEEKWLWGIVGLLLGGWLLGS